MTQAEMHKIATIVGGHMGIHIGLTVLAALEVAALEWDEKRARYFCLDFIDSHLRELKNEIRLKHIA